MANNIIVFDGSNYAIWSRATYFHLMSKKLIGAIETEKPKGGPTADEKAWDVMNEEAMGKITERISPEFYNHIWGLSTAKKIWEAIKQLGTSEERLTIADTRRRGICKPFS